MDGGIFWMYRNQSTLIQIYIGKLKINCRGGIDSIQDSQERETLEIFWPIKNHVMIKYE